MTSGQGVDPTLPTIKASLLTRIRNLGSAGIISNAFSGDDVLMSPLYRKLPIALIYSSTPVRVWSKYSANRLELHDGNPNVEAEHVRTSADIRNRAGRSRIVAAERIPRCGKPDLEGANRCYVLKNNGFPGNAEPCLYSCCFFLWFPPTRDAVHTALEYDKAASELYLSGRYNEAAHNQRRSVAIWTELSRIQKVHGLDELNNILWNNRKERLDENKRLSTERTGH